MKQRDEDPVRIDPDKETAERQDLHMMPGDLEDTETPSARETRRERNLEPEDVAQQREKRRT